MRPCVAFSTWLAGLCAAILSVRAAVADDDTVLFDFETEADVQAWANIDISHSRTATGHSSRFALRSPSRAGAR